MNERIDDVYTGWLPRGAMEKCIDLDLHKILKNCFSILKVSPTRWADYLQANDLDELHEGRPTGYMFPEIFVVIIGLKI